MSLVVLNTDAWELYISYRKDLKLKKYTERGALMIQKKLAALPESKQMECVQYSMERNWQGLFPEKFLKDDSAKPRPGSTDSVYTGRSAFGVGS